MYFIEKHQKNLNPMTCVRFFFDFSLMTCYLQIICKRSICVCLSVRACVCVYVWDVNFLSCDNLKQVETIALKFCMVICICFLKNLIDFGDDLPKIVDFRLYCRFCLIRAKSMFIGISREPMSNEDIKQSLINSGHKNL